jgi:hypothetical protein
MACGPSGPIWGVCRLPSRRLVDPVGEVLKVHPDVSTIKKMEERPEKENKVAAAAAGGQSANGISPPVIVPSKRMVLVFRWSQILSVATPFSLFLLLLHTHTPFPFSRLNLARAIVSPACCGLVCTPLARSLRDTRPLLRLLLHRLEGHVLMIKVISSL